VEIRIFLIIIEIEIITRDLFLLGFKIYYWHSIVININILYLFIIFFDIENQNKQIIPWYGNKIGDDMQSSKTHETNIPSYTWKIQKLIIDILNDVTKFIMGKNGGKKNGNRSWKWNNWGGKWGRWSVRSWWHRGKPGKYSWGGNYGKKWK